MSTNENQDNTNNPLVGKTVVVTYETGAPGFSSEINFISNGQKTSTGKSTADGYVATDNYEMAVVAPNIYMVSWMEDSDGHVVIAVWNFNTTKAYGSYSNSEPKHILELVLSTK